MSQIKKTKCPICERCYLNSVDSENYCANCGIVTLEVWTLQDQSAYAPLRRKRLRIDAKVRRDKTRRRTFKQRSRKT